MLVPILIALAATAVDQLVKHWATATLKAVGTTPIIQDVFHLTYSQNTGAAFSILQDQRWFFIIFTIIAMGLLLFLLKINYFPTRLSRVAVGFVLGGALGNFIDRARMGYVVDLFDFRLINFPIFNIADMALTCGVVLLIIHIFTLKDSVEDALKEEKDADQDS